MTTVVHVKKAPYDVYIGRGRDGDREEVIAKYIDWILVQPDLLACLSELKDKVLGCWCHPKQCHGDFLAGFVDKLIP